MSTRQPDPDESRSRRGDLPQRGSGDRRRSSQGSGSSEPSPNEGIVDGFMDKVVIRITAAGSEPRSRLADAPDWQAEQEPRRQQERADRERVRVDRPLDQPGSSRTKPPRPGEPSARTPQREAVPVTDDPQAQEDRAGMPKPMVEVLHEPGDAPSPSPARRPARPRVPAPPPPRPDVPVTASGSGPQDGEGPQDRQRPEAPASGEAGELQAPDPATAPAPRRQRPVLGTTVDSPAGRPTVGGTEDEGRTADAAPEGDAVGRAPGSVEPFVIEPSAFSSAPWWERGWWRLAPGGAARDVACDAGTLGTLGAAAVSLRGQKHRLDAAPNDDAFALCAGTGPDGTDWLIGCVCDGVGSAARASEGARFVAERFANALADLCATPEWADGAPGRSALDGVADLVRRDLALHFSIPPNDLATFETTLTFVAVEATTTGQRRALLGWTGDSPALVLRDGGWQDATGAAEESNAGPASTRTAGFLTHGVLEGAITLTLEADDVVMLCSDGVGAFVTDGKVDRQLGSILATVVDRPVDVLHLVNLMSFDMRSADDDRTALLVWQDCGPDATAG